MKIEFIWGQVQTRHRVKTLQKGCSNTIDSMHPEQLTLQSLIMSILKHKL